VKLSIFVKMRIDVDPHHAGMTKQMASSIAYFRADGRGK
jgi:hypothetical protein